MSNNRYVTDRATAEFLKYLMPNIQDAVDTVPGLFRVEAAAARKVDSPSELYIRLVLGAYSQDMFVIEIYANALSGDVTSYAMHELHPMVDSLGYAERIHKDVRPVVLKSISAREAIDILRKEDVKSMPLFEKIRGQVIVSANKALGEITPLTQTLVNQADGMGVASQDVFIVLREIDIRSDKITVELTTGRTSTYGDLPAQTRVEVSFFCETDDPGWNERILDFVDRQVQSLITYKK